MVWPIARVVVYVSTSRAPPSSELVMESKRESKISTQLKVVAEIEARDVNTRFESVVSHAETQSVARVRNISDF